MRLAWGAWAYGLLAAFIGGIGVACAAAVSSFSLKLGSHETLVIIVTTALVSGVSHMFAYLAEHPLPKWDGIDRRDEAK